MQRPEQMNLKAILALTSLACVMFLSGCSVLSSDNDFGEGALGLTVEELLDYWGYPLEINEVQGEPTISEFHYQPLTSCHYVLLVNDSDTVVGYRAEPNFYGACKPLG